MNSLLRTLKRNPSIAVGVAVFGGLALGAGWIPMPSALAGLIPSRTPAAPAGKAAAPAPPPDPLDQL